MARNNTNGNGVITPDTTACKCHKSASDDKNTADSAVKAGKTSIESKETAKGYKICCLDRARETHEVYQDILSCIALGNYKKTEIVKKNVDEYIKKDEQIEKLINESSKMLGDLCTKLDEANRAACSMKTKIVSKLNKCTEKESKEITDKLDEIIAKSEDLAKKGLNAYESVVAIAGVQTFTNTESLKDFVTLLMEAIKKFKECVEANISSSALEVKTAREELNAIVEQIAQLLCDGKTQGTTAAGLKEVIKFLCEDKCEDECIDVCYEFDKCCGAEDDTSYGKRKAKSTVDQN